MAEPLELGVTIPILILSTVGNLLTLVVLHRPVFADKSLTIFLRALAVADLLSTWLDPLSMKLLIPEFGSNTSDVGCRVYGYFFALVSIASSWTLVMVTLERVIIVYFPLKVDLLFNKRKAVLIVTGIWIFWAIVGSFTLVPSSDHSSSADTGNGTLLAEGLTEYTSSGECSLSQTLDTLKLVAFMVLYSLVPALTMITCNVLIVVALRKARNQRRRISTKTTPEPAKRTVSTSSARQQERLTLMLITISCVFVLLTLPEILVYAVEFFTGSRLPDALIWVCNFMRRLNHAVNFLLYCVSGVLFRRELVLTFSTLSTRFCDIFGIKKDANKERWQPVNGHCPDDGDEVDGQALRAPLRRNKLKLTDGSSTMSSSSSQNTKSTGVFEPSSAIADEQVC